MSEIKNRSAWHEYFIDDRYEAGLMLLGTEVKSIREGRVSFNDSYCLLHKGEVWVKSLHIAEYSHGNLNNHDPVRDRKLLLHKKEVRKIESGLKEKGYTLCRFAFILTTRGLRK
jgi:SsrA-binding protein